jgi:membrane protein implicated in regulation of membrane protease activity
MYLVAIAWLYVALMMAVAEAVHTQGSVLGGIITFILYGLAPVALAMYLLGTPARRRVRRRTEAAQATAEAHAAEDRSGPSLDPDGSGHAPAAAVPGPVAPVREEP